MKCYTHKDTEAVAVCVHCGMALCSTCATRSQSGRLVCSQTCAAASKQLEDFIASTRHKATRGARVNAYFCFGLGVIDRKSTRLNSSHLGISYAVFCLK